MHSVKFLTTTLAKSLVVGYPTYVLIDPLMGEPVPMRPGSHMNDSDMQDWQALSAVRENAWMRSVHHIQLHESIELPHHLHPYFVAMTGPSDAWLTATVELACEELQASRAEGLQGTGEAAHRIGAWLQSSQHPQELAQQLSVMMQVNTEAVTTKCYQRIADRRVWGWLRHVVGDTRTAAQLGRIKSWCYLDVYGSAEQIAAERCAVGCLHGRPAVACHRGALVG
jgi:hypothetical protein